MDSSKQSQLLNTNNYISLNNMNGQDQSYDHNVEAMLKVISPKKQMSMNDSQQKLQQITSQGSLKNLAQETVSKSYEQSFQHYDLEQPEDSQYEFQRWIGANIKYSAFQQCRVWCCDWTVKQLTDKQLQIMQSKILSSDNLQMILNKNTQNSFSSFVNRNGFQSNNHLKLDSIDLTQRNGNSTNNKSTTVSNNGFGLTFMQNTLVGGMNMIGTQQQTANGSLGIVSSNNGSMLAPNHNVSRSQTLLGIAAAGSKRKNSKKSTKNNTINESQNNQDNVIKSEDYYKLYQNKFQDLITTLEEEEKKREDLERRNQEVRDQLFRNAANALSQSDLTLKMNYDQILHQQQMKQHQQQQQQMQNFQSNPLSSSQSQIPISMTTPNNFEVLSQNPLSFHSTLHLPDAASNMPTDYKDRLISQLTIENRRVRDELAQSHFQKFQLEQDLDYLQQTVENHLPFFHMLEQKNQVLSDELNQKSKIFQTAGNSSAKVRKLEDKCLSLKKDYNKEKWRLTEENKSLKERLEVLRKMNFHLQKLTNHHKRKADQADGLLKRCIELEKLNQKLVSIAYGDKLSYIDMMNGVFPLRTDNLTDTIHTDRATLQKSNIEPSSKLQYRTLSRDHKDNHIMINDKYSLPSQSSRQEHNYSERPQTQSPQLLQLLGLQKDNKIKHSFPGVLENHDRKSKHLSSGLKPIVDPNNSSNMFGNLPAYALQYLEEFGENGGQSYKLQEAIKSSFSPKDYEYILMEAELQKQTSLRSNSLISDVDQNLQNNNSKHIKNSDNNSSSRNRVDSEVAIAGSGLLSKEYLQSNNQSSVSNSNRQSIGKNSNRGSLKQNRNMNNVIIREESSKFEQDQKDRQFLDLLK
eukprot:403346003